MTRRSQFQLPLNRDVKKTKRRRMNKKEGEKKQGKRVTG